MEKVNKSKIELLKKFIYNSDIHDSIFRKKIYKNKCLTIETFNKYSKVKNIFVFDEVKFILSLKKESPIEIAVSDDEILELTIEENYDFLKDYANESSDFFDDSFYLVFHLDSGNELHIVSKYAAMETIR